MEKISEKRYTTFHDWTWQLHRACIDDRLKDVDAIANLRAPERVAVADVREVTTADEWRRETATHEDLRLVPHAAMAGIDAERKLSRRPWRRRALLRKPFQFQGPSLFWARSVPCMRALIDAGACIDDLGWMGIPLVVSVAQLGDLPMLRYLLEEHGQDPNATRADGGYTALHWARGRDVVEYLLERGADPHALTQFGDSVVAQLVRRGDAEALEAVLSLGLERISVANAFHWLHEASDPAVLAALLRAGLDPNEPIPPIFGEYLPTLVLHKTLRAGIHKWRDAGESERAEIGERTVERVRLALEHGCDPRRRDGTRQLAYHVLVDHRALLDEGLYARLEDLLSTFDGPREDDPGRPLCTCGLNL